ncbi:hypothetical protein N9B05_04470 [Mariniblastus sp.]|nr:hypothetical protein [Mariniblastus sp.]
MEDQPSRLGDHGRYTALAMRWSKLKQLIESGFAPEIAGRVQFHTTRYRNAHDAMGRSWITLDDVEIANMQHLSGAAANEHPDRIENGIFTAYDLPNSMRQYLNMNIDEALSSDNPLIRAMAVIDRRLGKRRVQLLDAATETFPVNTLIHLRQNAEENAV